MLYSATMSKRFIASLFLLASSVVHGANVDISVEALPPLDPPWLIDNGINVFPLLFILPFDIDGVNSATLNIEVFDDGRNDRNEQFRVLLQTQGPGNVLLGSFNNNLGSVLEANDPASAYTFSHTFNAGELAALYNEISCGCGSFWIRVNRDEGDFYLSGAAMEMNVSTPEPATVGLAASALVLLGLIRRRATPKAVLPHPRKD
jgi:MYXO-CTERM domain-containing protein